MMFWYRIVLTHVYYNDIIEWMQKQQTISPIHHSASHVT